MDNINQHDINLQQEQQKYQSNLDYLKEAEQSGEFNVQQIQQTTNEIMKSPAKDMTNNKSAKDTLLDAGEILLQGAATVACFIPLTAPFAWATRGVMAGRALFTASKAADIGIKATKAVDVAANATNATNIVSKASNITNAIDKTEKIANTTSTTAGNTVRTAARMSGRKNKGLGKFKDKTDMADIGDAAMLLIDMMDDGKGARKKKSKDEKHKKIEARGGFAGILAMLQVVTDILNEASQKDGSLNETSRSNRTGGLGMVGRGRFSALAKAAYTATTVVGTGAGTYGAYSLVDSLDNNNVSGLADSITNTNISPDLVKMVNNKAIADNDQKGFMDYIKESQEMPTTQQTQENNILNTSSNNYTQNVAPKMQNGM